MIPNGIHEGLSFKQYAASSTSALSTSLEVLHPWLCAEPAQALVAAKCIGLMQGFDSRWERDRYLIEDVECTIDSTLYNPETHARSRTFSLAGKIDVRAKERATGATVLIDHKTTVQDIADPNAPYWRQMVIEGQLSHYMLLEWQSGRKTDYGLWNVVRKPSISPKQISKKEREEIYILSRYCGTKLTSVERDEIAASERETPWMYALRLAQDCSVERPEWYFQRRQVPRMDAEIHEYAMELWGHGQDLILSRRNGRHPRNSGACMNYGTPCKFLGICSGHDSPDSDKWAKKLQVHAELAIEGDGRNVLTNSRIRTFQTCRRKHELQYEIGIERVEEEEREALFFGSLFHQALEAYFLQLKQQQLRGAA